MHMCTLKVDGLKRRARYAHSMRVFVFNSGLFYIRPTPAALDLLDRLVHRVETENGWDQAIFNEARLRQLLRRGHVPRFASLPMNVISNHCRGVSLSHRLPNLGFETRFLGSTSRRTGFEASIIGGP